MMKKILWTLFLFLPGAYASIAQNDQGGKIMARLLDEKGTAIEDATASLLSAKDSILTKAAVSGKNGVVEFENIRIGNYILSVTRVGFEKYNSALITVSAANLDINLKDISMAAANLSLQAVTVETKKPFIERKMDKMVINVENSIVGAGNSVLEVLERSPGVQVNQESSINIKGKQGVIVMIDGKPSPLSGADLITYLKGIPASDIATIEIITQPSARYDAAGNAGIINIKFKKDQRQGFNGAFTVNYGQGFYFKPSGSTNFNFRKMKWNLFGNYSHAQPLNFTRFYINRKFFNAGGGLQSTFDQTSFIKQPVTTDNTRFGADFYASKKTVVGVMFNMNWNGNGRDGTTNSIITKPNGQLDYKTQTAILLAEDRFNGFGNFNFKHSFDSTGKELTADIDYGKFRATTLQDINNVNNDANNALLSSNKLKTDQRGVITVKSFKADYIHPLKNKAKIEAGIKTSFVQSDNDVKFFNILDLLPVPDLSRSNHFIYDENVNAVYTNFAKEFKKTEVQVGLRVEHTHTRGKQLATGENFSRNYLNIFPSFVINQKFSENNQLSFSYSQRIDRPSYRQLNPFRIFVDPYTYVVGDPTLRPVLTNSFELNYTFKSKYITSLSYARSREEITEVFVQDDATKISYQVPANLQNFDQLYLGLYIPITVKGWLSSNISSGLYWSRYASPLQGGQLVNDFTSWDVQSNNSITLGKKGWSAELSGFYQAKNAWGLFIIRNLAQVSTGIQKVSRNKNSTYKLAVSDIFYTNRVAVLVKYQNMDFFTNRNWDSQVATLSFTHRFGRNTVARARQRSSGVEDEKRRAG